MFCKLQLQPFLIDLQKCSENNEVLIILNVFDKHILKNSKQDYKGYIVFPSTVTEVRFPAIIGSPTTYPGFPLLKVLSISPSLIQNIENRIYIQHIKHILSEIYKKG